MNVYSLWNNKGGVGKSYLTFQIACEYASQNPNLKVLVVDMCPQANSSSMLLGGIDAGERQLTAIHTRRPRQSISGYFEERIRSPYQSPASGSNYAIQVRPINSRVPSNLYLVAGDEGLELQASRVLSATRPGPQDAWRLVQLWVRDLIEDIAFASGDVPITAFVDCNPSFSIFTQQALTASNRLLVPFSADGSSKRSVKALLALVYGQQRYQGDPQSEYYLNMDRERMALPKIYKYIGNRLTQMNNSSASAFKTVVSEIGDEIWSAYQSHPSYFQIHPPTAFAPRNQREFKRMFQYEVRDANTASVVSGALGIPIGKLRAGHKAFAGRRVQVNQSQLDKQYPNVRDLVSTIE